MASEYAIFAFVRGLGIVRLSVLEYAVSDVQDSVRELVKLGLAYVPVPGFIARVR